MKSILQWTAITIVLVGALSFVAFRSADSDFLSKASQANLAEIEAGKLASTQGSSAAVKKLGKQMVMDHTTAQAELVALAKKEGVSIPMEPDADHKAMKESLMGMSGTGFDSAYVAAQLKDHQTAVSLFTDESKNGTDDASKMYAQKYLPKLKMHLKMVQSNNMNMAPGTSM